MDTAALWPGTLAGTGTTVADDSDGVDEGEAGDIEGVTVSVVVKVAEAETSRVLAEVPDPLKAGVVGDAVDTLVTVTLVVTDSDAVTT